MEEGSLKPKKTSKAGPLKSSPGFLKCMRSVYLYFKEEKEKGALNIPINSFIERTAVACGVGRKTLYNYAKKGLFDEHPTILQPKKKKRIKRLISPCNSFEDARKGKGKESENVSVKRKSSRSILIQTDIPTFSTSSNDNNGINVITSTNEDRTKRGKLEVQGPWSVSSSRREIEYFTKNNIWQSVYSISSPDSSNINPELPPTRINTCPTATSTLTDL